MTGIKKRVAVIGEGAWGTAIATVLAHNGYEVLLWCYDQKNAEQIRRTRCNDRYLPGIELDKAIIPVTDFALIAECEWIAEAIPTQYLRAVLRRMRREFESLGKSSGTPKWVVLSKGFEKDGFAFPGQIITDIFGKDTSYVVVAGPTYAQELARKQVSAAMVASFDEKLLGQAATLLQSDYFKLYPTHDVMGVQICGALKNVIALALGMLEGAEYGQNTRSFFLSLGFQEMVCIAESFGAQRETVYGLAGFGDLILTSYGGLSKNFALGRSIGQTHLGISVVGLGHTPYEIIVEGGEVVPEGINTLASFFSYTKKQGMRAPIIKAIYEVVYEGEPVKNIIDAVLCIS